MCAESNRLVSEEILLDGITVIVAVLCHGYYHKSGSERPQDKAFGDLVLSHSRKVND